MCAPLEDCFLREKTPHPSLQTRSGAYLTMAEASPSGRMGPKSSLGRQRSSVLAFGEGHTYLSTHGTACTEKRQTRFIGSGMSVGDPYSGLPGAEARTGSSPVLPHAAGGSVSSECAPRRWPGGPAGSGSTAKPIRPGVAPAPSWPRSGGPARWQRRTALRRRPLSCVNPEVL